MDLLGANLQPDSHIWVSHFSPDDSWKDNKLEKHSELLVHCFSVVAWQTNKIAPKVFLKEAKLFVTDWHVHMPQTSKFLSLSLAWQCITDCIEVNLQDKWHQSCFRRKKWVTFWFCSFHKHISSLDCQPCHTVMCSDWVHEIIVHGWSQSDNEWRKEWLLFACQHSGGHHTMGVKNSVVDVLVQFHTEGSFCTKLLLG